MKSILYFALGVATLALATLSGGSRAIAQEPPRPSVRIESVFPVSAQPSQYELVHQILEFRPGASTYEHTHGGPAFVTVLEGESTIREGETERTYAPRQTYSEAQGVALTAINKSAATTRVMASFLLSPGAPQTVNRLDSPRPAVATVASFVSRATLVTQPAQFNLTQRVLDFAPGASMLLPANAGHGLATVMAGDVAFRAGAAEVRRSPGGTFSDLNAAPEIRNVGSGTASVMISLLAPKALPSAILAVAGSAPQGPASAGQPAALPQIRPPATGDGALVPGLAPSRSFYASLALPITLALFAMGIVGVFRSRLI